MSLAVECQKFLDRAAGIPLVWLLRAMAGRPGRSAPSAASAAPVQRVLLVKLWGIGNLAMILPLARAVKNAWPAAQVDFLSLQANREFIEACPAVDRGIYFSHRGGWRPLLELVALARRLRHARYDLILDFEQFLKTTALLTWFARPALSVGFRTRHQWRHGLYHRHALHDDRRHMALVFGDIVRAAGIDPEGVPPLFVPQPRRSPRVRRLMQRLRQRYGPVVAMHIGSGDNFEGRRWPVGHFARVAELVHARGGACVVFTGTDRERGLVATCRRGLRAPSVDLTGCLDLGEWIDLLGQVDLLISNDTAPVHLGSALGIPLIALYGPNTPRLYGPLSPQAQVFYRGLACSPCITNSNAKTSFCRRPLCLTSIDPAAVAAAALSMLPRPVVDPVEEPR